MRRTAATPLLVLVVLLVGFVAACTDDDPATTTTTSTTASSAPDPALEALALAASDLPAGFAASPEVDDTITAFCVNEDATAGLQASARVVRGFTRTPAGASVIQLVFRFKDDGATTFVTQANEILDRCSGVPDVTGLAFEYDALTAGLDDPIAAASETHIGRYGVSVGSGSLAVDLVVFQDGDIGQLVAVLGLDLPRAELDALASTAFTAAATKVGTSQADAG
ncbi:MAG: hypothetical protein ACRDZU_13430 [Acidimicrobiales bacterium]